MAIDPEFRKLLNGDAWASAGDRTDLDDTSVSPTIARNIGWQASFSTTDTPARTRMNQIFRELYGGAKELAMGVSLYDAGVSYPVNSIVQHSSKLWRAQTAHDANNPVAPAGSGQSVWQEIASTNVTAPTQPADISNNDILIDYDNGSNFRVYWNAPDDGGRDITQYDVRYSKTSTFTSGVFTLSNYTQGTTITANIPAGEADLFYVQVRARNAIGTPSWPSTAGKRVSTSALAPEAINFLQATPGNANVVLNWGQPFMRGLTLLRYRVEWRSGSQSFTSTGSRHSNIAAGTTTATISGLTNGTAYTFRVIAVSARSTETAGSYTITSTPTAGDVATAPNTPINLSASVGAANGSLIAQSNEIPADNGAKITSFGWRMRTAATGEGGTPGTWGDPPSPNSASTNVPINTFTGLTDVNWEIQMNATNSAGTSGWSNTATGNPVYPSLPSAPTIEAIASRTPSTGGGVIAYISSEIDDGGADITAIEWRRKLTSASDTDTNWFVFSSSGTPMLVARTETAGTSVDFQARAVNSVGKGPWSSTESVVPPAATPTPVTPAAPGTPQFRVGNILGAVGHSKVRLSLTEYPDDNGSAITDFVWQYRLSSSSTWTTVTVPALQRGWVFQDIGDGLLTNWETYSYRVGATNAQGTTYSSVDVQQARPTTTLSRPKAPTLVDWSTLWAGGDYDGGGATPFGVIAAVNDVSIDTGGQPLTDFQWQVNFSQNTIAPTSGTTVTQLHAASNTTESLQHFNAGGMMIRGLYFPSALSVSPSVVTNAMWVRLRYRNATGWGAWSAWKRLVAQIIS